MQEDHYVVVPHDGGTFYVARVTGAAYHDPKKVHEDTGFRRPVEWLNNKVAIPRRQGSAALQSRMKAYNTCVDATDLLTDVKESSIRPNGFVSVCPHCGWRRVSLQAAAVMAASAARGAGGGGVGKGSTARGERTVWAITRDWPEASSRHTQ
jgi:hypothetical protein